MPCTIKVLLDACQATYRTDGLKENGVEFLAKNPDIVHSGYSFGDSITHPNTGLTAVCLVPTDSDNPIIIAYQGTEFGNVKDIMADYHIAIYHEVNHDLKAEANAFFNKMAKLHKGREIIITGHSLGGNLAQEVGLTAILAGMKGVFVRTFNSAPITTQKGKNIEEYDASKLNHVANYRLSSDKISAALSGFYNWYGDIYSFYTKKFFFSRESSHLVGTMKNEIPEDIQRLQVGGSGSKTAGAARLQEQIFCMQKSYECRIDRRWFSWRNAGKKNLRAFNLYLPIILASLSPPEGQKQIPGYLRTLNGMLDGSVSKAIVKTLEESIEINLAVPECDSDSEESSELLTKKNLRQLKAAIDNKSEDKSLSEDDTAGNSEENNGLV
jgi:hypothetical protein